MSIFDHHIYEYKKGVRRLFLHTVPRECIEDLKQKLNKRSISYEVCELGNTNLNIFFGDDLCLDVLRQFSSKKLNELSIEEDFILGVMLGYGYAQQCQRYLTRKNNGSLSQLRQDACRNELQLI